MVKPNYSFEKRQRELAKKRKKEEKAGEKAARKAQAKSGAPGAEDEAEGEEAVQASEVLDEGATPEAPRL